MNTSDSTTESPAPAPVPAAPAPASTVKRAPRRGVGLAFLLALVALLVASYSGWRQWRFEQGGLNRSQALEHLHAQMHVLGDKLDGLGKDNSKLQQQVQVVQQRDTLLATQLQRLSERSHSLENAVAGLTARTRSGHDAVHLDEAGMLLHIAAERFALFHDADGAMKAYSMADQVLAEVDDPAYVAVRQSIGRERQALAVTHPGRRQDNLATLARLRGEIDSLPLKPIDAAPKSSANGFLARVKHAFSSLVRIQRDDGSTPSRRALVRTLTVLDLAQAQAALLAWDIDGYRRALAQADGRLQRAFDPASAAVHTLRGQLARLRGQPDQATPELGAALRELNNLRDVHETTADPAPTTSVVLKGMHQ